MDQKIVEKRVIELIAKSQKIPVENIKPDSLIEDFCEDSLDMVNLLFAFEDEFQVSIPDEAKASRSINDIVAGIHQLLEIQHETIHE